MARAKTKKTAQRPAPAAAAKRAGASKGSAGGEVTRRWADYWKCRKQLEESVERVRAATQALRSAQEQEKARRVEFDEIKRSLTKLLDVDPVAPREPGQREPGQRETSQREMIQRELGQREPGSREAGQREPIQLARNVAEPTPKARPLP